MSHRVVVIALHGQRGFFHHFVDNFSRLRAVIDKIAEHPEFVVVLREGAPSVVVSMDVSDYDEFHRGAYYFRTRTAPKIRQASSAQPDEAHGVMWKPEKAEVVKRERAEHLSHHDQGKDRRSAQVGNHENGNTDKYCSEKPAAP